jgi:peptide subunit release factor 1 (eRF1)
MKMTGDLDFLAKQPAKPSSPMLSIYLNVEPSTVGRLNRNYDAELLRRLQSIQEQLSDEAERRNFRASARRVKQFLAEHKPTGQGLILFCNDRDRLFWWRDIKVPVPSDVRWNTGAHIRPLLELGDEFERYGIILTDREEAHLFTVFMGEIEQNLEVISSTKIKRFKTAGSDHMRSQTQFQRKTALHAIWHLKKVVKLAKQQMSLNSFDRLVLAGPSEATRALHRLLPKRLSARVVATIPLPIHSTPEEILEATLSVERAVERNAEVSLVEDLIVSASKGVKAVTGLAATLLASNNGEIWKLVYAQDSNVPGKCCKVCDRLYGVDRFSCGHCNVTLHPVEDVIEIMIERLTKLGRTIEQVRGEASETLKQVEGIGAFLCLQCSRPRQAAAKRKPISVRRILPPGS